MNKLLLPLNFLLKLRLRSIPKNIDYMLFCHDNNRSYFYKNLPYSQLIDTFRWNIIKYGYSTLSVAKPYSSLTGKRAFGSPVSVTYEYLVFVIIASFFRYITNGFKKDQSITYAKLDFWHAFLRYTSPYYIIAIQPPEDLCCAAKKYNIPTYDLQHGIIDISGNDNYYKGRDMSLLGDDGIPTHCLCWNKFSSKSINSIWPGERALVVGNPWIQRFLFLDTSDELVEYENSSLANKINTKYKQKYILITTQGLAQIPEHILKTITLLASKGFKFLIKYHPVQVKKFGTLILNSQYKSLLGKDVWSSIQDVSDFALPSILMHTSYHMTGFSACTYEASIFNIKTGFWDSRAELLLQWFQHEFSIDHAEILPSTASDASKLISYQILSNTK